MLAQLFTLHQDHLWDGRPGGGLQVGPQLKDLAGLVVCRGTAKGVLVLAHGLLCTRVVPCVSQKEDC